MNAGHAGAGEGMFETFRAFGDDKAPRAWYLVYQSKGERPGQWLGPDLEELIDACAASEVRALVVCPVGFFTDHMETLYDLDIIAAERAVDGRSRVRASARAQRLRRSGRWPSPNR